MILLTLGTTDMRFERLVKAIDDAVGNKIINDEVFAQIGCSRYTPKNMKYARLLEKNEFDNLFKKASFIIGHAGMGTITMALDHNKPALLVPRLSKYKEHVNDHQLSTAKRFEELGHIVCLYDLDNEEEIRIKIREANSFTPMPRNAEPDKLAANIIKYIHNS